MTHSTLPGRAALRVAISEAIDQHSLRHLPQSVEVVRYSIAGDDTHEVDMLVPPGFGKQAADVIPRIRTRYIQTVSAGVETVRPMVPEGVVLCNAQGVHNASTAEWAVTAILASLKWIPFYDELRREGVWGGRAQADAYWTETYGSAHSAGAPILLEELAEKTVLIVGYGSIGKAIEARLAPFEPGRIVRLARTRREGVHGVDELNALLPEADIVVLIMPLTPDTHHMIGREQLARMRRGAFLVNAARGAVVDTDALVEALEAHHIRAALDVTEPEPLPAGHPLWKAPGLLLTPHIAGSSPLFLDRVFRFVGQQLQHLLNGEQPENIITGEY
ncbi:2-hydroxyacid dehydrogenase [Acidipila sp. EB88]|uniref:2-hydroxyacid dehydrogenase n=1 Tax=Acidipila sp. EB88 TaxID=2305226 RepID=UPI000F5FEDA6|nr:2-hydroxyacid dehydrogenase [Acidipila sp. EB88]RRA47856.1 hydroxyacid dehydrogenase [Acidipila sp. EB88]